MSTEPTVDQILSTVEEVASENALTTQAHKNKASRLAELARALGRAASTISTSTDVAYEERNRVAAALAHLIIAIGGKAGRSKTAIDGWDPAWQNIVYIDTPTGQVSFHYHDREAELFADLPEYAGEWDGHTKADVFNRLAEMKNVTAAPAEAEGARDWLVWSGQYKKWWGPGARGYYPNLEDAGRFTEAQARSIEARPAIGRQPNTAVHEPFALGFLEQIGQTARTPGDEPISRRDDGTLTTEQLNAEVTGEAPHATE